MKSPSLVHELLEASAERDSEQPFILHDDAVLSYGQIEVGANRMAQALRAEGLADGDRVGLLAQNSRFYVEAYYGALKAGAIVVPLNTAADAPSLARFIAGCGARFLIAGTRFESVAKSAAELGCGLEVLAVGSEKDLPELPGQVRGLALDEACENASAHALHLSLDPESPAAIIYTSGSTGTPQGATLSHRNILANSRSIVSYLGLTAADRVLQVLPFYYVYGQSLLNTHAMAGGSVVIENGFMFPKTALDTLETQHCTGFSGVPSTFAILLNRTDLAERRLEQLRYVTQAGGAMSPDVTRRLIEALPRQEIFVMYGATEASARLAYLPPADLERKLGSIGKGIPGVELRVMRPNGSEADVGEHGEIVARGDNIMSGYWDDPDGTAEVLRAGGYHTGDVAYADDEGFLFVVGRQKDFIKAGAHRVSAKEIEEAIVERPEIHEAAVIGVPDETLGESIRAFVVLRPDTSLDPKDLIKALRKRLPAYKVPAEVVILDDLPKNESGKIMKQSLRERGA